ncbi:hypothetical protein [Streptomyces phaeochromogenes]|uniref:hypothetical protein n=1 Tax=Streptomyces phaeochromogenes TaxID=1923 RepID=UPI002DDA354D|nr:hypothetical protein [Streptomyces phaeochromogenes]WRZ32652.1 hypothetical protein OG931_35455 [Streptomyces phaeochromogenes]
MSANRSVSEEPRLVVNRPERSRLRRTLALTLPVPVVGLVLLLASGHLLMPLDRVVTIEAKMASKRDFFEDPEVQRILMEHGFRVHITNMGSRDIANQDVQGYDVVFPSGQPAADLITNKRAKAGNPVLTYRPFVSPIVLGTYRAYAETLKDAGVAEPQRNGGVGGRPLYYTLNMAKFLTLTADGRRWKNIGIKNHGVENGNKILAQTSNICQANSGGTYLGLVAFVRHGNDAPNGTREAEDLAREIKPLLVEQGLPSAEMAETYLSPNGKSISPIAVFYEHQYLAHQIRHQKAKGGPDTDRVLLYPDTRFVTEPQLVALTKDGERLGRLVTRNPELQARAVELGFRPRDATADGMSDQLAKFLTDRRIQAPVTSADDTKAVLPSLTVLERMIQIVGDCPEPQKDPK